MKRRVREREETKISQSKQITMWRDKTKKIQGSQKTRWSNASVREVKEGREIKLEEIKK